MGNLFFQCETSCNSFSSKCPSGAAKYGHWSVLLQHIQKTVILEQKTAKVEDWSGVGVWR
jgi:hypothetical protein